VGYPAIDFTLAGMTGYIGLMTQV